MGLIAPGKNVVCIEDVACSICGLTKAKKDAVYMCAVILGPDIAHALTCDRQGCDSFMLGLSNKDCGLCACCFKPLDDGDTSLLENEKGDDPYSVPGFTLHPADRPDPPGTITVPPETEDA